MSKVNGYRCDRCDVVANLVGNETCPEGWVRVTVNPASVFGAPSEMDLCGLCRMLVKDALAPPKEHFKQGIK